MSRRIFWTNERLRRLRALAQAGRTRVQAAAAMAVSPSAVAGACYRHHIEFRSAPPAPVSHLAQEIEAARAEAATAPPYRSSAGWPG